MVKFYASQRAMTLCCNVCKVECSHCCRRSRYTNIARKINDLSYGFNFTWRTDYTLLFPLSSSHAVCLTDLWAIVELSLERLQVLPSFYGPLRSLHLEQQMLEMPSYDLCKTDRSNSWFIVKILTQIANRLSNNIW